MAGKAKTRKTFGKKLKDQTVDVQKLYSMAGAKSTPQASTMSFAGGQSSSTPDTIDEFQRLKTSGGTMIGAIAYLPKITVIDGNGAINLLPSSVTGSTTDDYTSYLLVTPVGSADDLQTISNASNGGQILHLEANTTGTITLKHNTGNIFIPSTNDHIIPAGGFATLIFDEVIHINKWVLVSSSNTASSSWVGTATSDLNMATYDITNICRLEFDPAGSTLANSTTGIDATATKMHFNVADSSDYFEFTANGTERLFVGTSQIKWRNASGDALEIMNDLIPDTDNDFDLGSSSNEWKDLYLDGIAYIDTVSAGTISVTTFSTTGTSNLGDGDTDQVNFYGKTDWKTNVTSSSATTGSREGYITIKINGTDKKLYYYS